MNSEKSVSDFLTVALNQSLLKMASITEYFNYFYSSWLYPLHYYEPVKSRTTQVAHIENKI